MKWKKRKIGIIQSIFIFSGLFLFLINFFPLYSYYTTTRKNMDSGNLPKEVFQLPYKLSNKEDSSYLISYSDEHPKKLKLKLNSNIESVNGLWSGSLSAYSSGEMKGELKVDPQNIEKEWDDSILYKRTRTLSPTIDVIVPLTKKLRFKWITINVDANIRYPYGLKKGLKFENRTASFLNKFNFFVISDKDLKLRIENDKWKAIIEAGKEKSLSITFMLIGVLFFLSGFWKKAF
jgi:hypothetical protein